MAGEASEAARVCHEEQLRVWAEELVSDLAAGDFLREGMDYAEGVDLHRAVMAEIERIVTSAFEHPEATLRARVAELEAALREAARYLPHGDRYDGAIMLRPDEAAVAEMAHRALNTSAGLLTIRREANMSGEAGQRMDAEAGALVLPTPPSPSERYRLLCSAEHDAKQAVECIEVGDWLKADILLKLAIDQISDSGVLP